MTKVKSQIRKTIDLSIGDPAFLRPFWVDDRAALTVPQHSFMGYQYGGLKKLLLNILKVHRSINNVHLDERSTVVIGTGATQILLAAMWAYRELGCASVFAQRPYWYRFPDMAKILQMPWSTDAGAVQIVTSPNNPDGNVSAKHLSSHLIVDACYNWPQYTNPKPYLAPVVVFSLAKATGHAGSRVGWAIVRDPHVAELMHLYVEQSSGGASVEAQVRAIRLLSSPRRLKQVFKDGRSELLDRWHKIYDASMNSCVANNHASFRILNGSYVGMFAWCSLVYPGDAAQIFCTDYGVKAMSGAKLGGYLYQCRVNIGGDRADFDEAIKRIYGKTNPT
jgi:L-tryptophan--pyruvate aminotransferase